MKLYQDNGYVNIKAIKDLHLPFNFIVGGRGTGKTYTALKEQYESGEMFILMRRTQAQLDTISRKEFSPFKTINRDIGSNIGVVSVSKYNGAFYNMIEGDKPGLQIPDGPAIGYTCALSTIANIRGFDAQDVKTLIYDEFIPEKHERPIRNEGQAFLNAYETINRNRELKGADPLQVIAMANSNDLANPIFLELGIAAKVEKMVRAGKEISIDRARGIGVFLLRNSPISNIKNNTALYKLTAGSEFQSMAIDNIFAHENSARIYSADLRQYKPIVAVGELCVYKSKGVNGYYCSTHLSGSPPMYGTGEIERKRFARDFSWLWLAYLNRDIDFESQLCEKLLTKYLN